MANILPVAALAAALFIPAAHGAQSYPNRPLRLILPSAPGGLPDIQARLMANELVEAARADRSSWTTAPAGARMIGFEAMAKATPDGYTSATRRFPVATNPSMLAKLPYDFDRDFRPVMHQVSALNILAVSPSLQIAIGAGAGRARPGQSRQAVVRDLRVRGEQPPVASSCIKMMTGTRHRAGSVQGHPAGDRGRDRRADPRGVRQHGLDHAAREGGPHARARRHFAQALARHAGHADRRRSRACPATRSCRGAATWCRRKRPRTSSSGSTRNSTRRSSRPRCRSEWPRWAASRWAARPSSSPSTCARKPRSGRKVIKAAGIKPQ